MFGWKVAPGVVAAAAAALAVSASAWPCAAAPSLRDMIFPRKDDTDGRRTATPKVARFVAEDGSRFVLDRSSGLTLLKFEDSSEVWVLYPSRAPRGDIIFRNDLNQPVIRVTSLGGTTLYFRARSGGAPAAVMGQAAQIRLQNFTAQALLQRLAQASVRASRAAGRLIVFDAPDVTQGSEAVYADAAALAAEAVASISQRKNGRKTIQKIERVQLIQNGKVDAIMNGRTLVVSLTPRRGVAGRPSSHRIMLAAASAR